MSEVGLSAASSTQRQQAVPLRIAQRHRKPISSAVARMRHGRDRARSDAELPPLGKRSNSLIASTWSKCAPPGSNPCEKLYPPGADPGGLFGSRKIAHSYDAHHTPRPPESDSATLVIQEHLKV